MSQKETALKFMFNNKNAAISVKTALEKKYPQLVITVTEHANMVICSTRSITFDTKLEEEVINLGGLII